MARTARTFALASMAALAITMVGCNSPSLVEANADRAIDYRSASDRFGHPAASEGLYILEHGKFGQEESAAIARSRTIASDEFNPAGMVSIHVAVHRSNSRVLRQAGWAETQVNGLGDRRYKIFNNDWVLLATLNNDGFLVAPNGSQPWGERAFDLQDASRTLFGSGSYMNMDTSKYDLTTNLVFRSLQRFEDQSPDQRGIRVQREPDVVSLRPIASGDLTRAANALSRGEFYKRERERAAAIKAQRDAEPASRVPNPREGD